MFSPWKMTLLWLLYVVGGSARLSWGKGSRLAVWIPGNRHPLDRPATLLRWSLVTLATLMIWQGWRLTMGATADTLLVVLGSALLLVFFCIPDASFHLSSLLRLSPRTSPSSENS